MLLLIGYQRLVIEGSAIRVKSTATLYRWCSFDAREVCAIRYHGPGFHGMSVGLSLALSASQDGSVRSLPSWASMWCSESSAIDNPVFLALVGAVARPSPEIVVEGLPASYAGPLRTPALLVRADTG